MFSLFERRIAFRYLRARRSEGAISIIAAFSVLGICLGVATLIIVMSVMNGFREELTKQILGFNGHINVYPARGEVIHDYDDMAEQIRKLPGIVGVNPVVDRQAMVLKGNLASGMMIHGITAADLAKNKSISKKIKAGTLEGFDEGNNIAIGTKLAAKLGLAPGDNLTLVSPKGSSTAFGTVPRMRPFKVVALFEVGMYQYDSATAFMSMKAAQNFFELDGGVTGLEIFVDDPDKVKDVTNQLAGVLSDRYLISDWEMANAQFFNALKVERNVMFLILTMIILIAAFNIISSLIMLVKDKSRDIAILRTMGATRGSIMRIFFLTGASTGIAGTVVGFTLGLVFSLNIETIRQWIQKLSNTQLFSPEVYYLSKLPSKVEPDEVITVVVLSLALSFLATLYPAWRAAKLDPVEALRYE